MDNILTKAVVGGKMIERLAMEKAMWQDCKIKATGGTSVDGEVNPPTTGVYIIYDIT